MTFAIQLFVDPVSDTAVRSVWEELATTGLSHMRDSGNRPHVSLALYRELDVSVCASLSHRLLKRMLPLFSPSRVWGCSRRSNSSCSWLPSSSRTFWIYTGRSMRCCKVLALSLGTITSQGIGLLIVHLQLGCLLISSLKWSRLA